MPEDLQFISIAPLLNSLTGRNNAPVNASEISAALTLVYDNGISSVQLSSLLTALRSSSKDRDPLVIAKCANSMRNAAVQVDRWKLKGIARSRGRQEGSYRGGFCDIVGTGGDGHSTFNVSTTASILASTLLLLAKHGNRASSSMSGSANLLQSIKPTAPKIESVTSETLPGIYQKSNYAFLFAPNFHLGMKHAALVRKELGFRTIFNLLGPLANPLEGIIEARIVGVAEREMGPIFAEALRLTSARKALIVCGAEDLDEISCAGKTYCWYLKERPNPKFRGPIDEEDEDFTTTDEEGPPRMLISIEAFELKPEHFGAASHPLAEVFTGKLPEENAEMLIKILQNKLPIDSPVVEFVLINTAALFAISGVCEANTSNMGFGDDGNVIEERGPGGLRWKEGMRRAKWALKSGRALESLATFIEVSRCL